MVYIIDEESVFDAPVDKIWKYLQSEQHRHPSIKELGREVNGNVVLITSERNIMGKAVQVKIRNTLYPPLGWAQEHLEGPLAGSKAFQYYVPKGGKTGVIVVGDYVAKGLDERSIRGIVLDQAQISFDEDNSNLKKMTV
jgi:hypothetical protein